jgi:hypothetical protein
VHRRTAEAELVFCRTAAGHRSWRSLCLAKGLRYFTLQRFFGGRNVRDEFVAELAAALRLTRDQ